jgi:alanine-glyoxylate transaminase/serine-glyoxylate transaminase/serine-pyruvate transaminase
MDAVYSGSQKCLSCTPGLSPVTFSKKAVKKIKNRTTKVQSWFLDMNLVMNYWGNGQAKRAYHHTAPVNALYGMHEALLMVQEEGLDDRWERHQKHHLALKEGLEELGFRYLVDEEYRLPQLNAVFLPEGLNEAQIRKQLLEDHMLEVGGGLGAFAGKIWRIGLMGYSARAENVEYCLGALREILA